MKVNARTASILVFAVIAASAHAAPPMDAGAQKGLLAADRAWAAAYSAKDLSKSAAAVDSQASLLWPNAPAIVGKTAIAKAIKDDFSQGNLSWRANSARVARSGDLGYTLGDYTLKSASGGAVVDNGKYLTVWMKEADGSWKVLLDMFNTDRPATGQ